MRPAGNENKGAMKLRVDFKKKHTGESVWSVYVFVISNITELDLLNVIILNE